MKLSDDDLKALSVDELWALHEQIGTLLLERITAEKLELEQRLAKLDGLAAKATMTPGILKSGGRPAASRKYPPVLPKYENPSDPHETWAGRGKQPRWLVSQLKAGRKVSDFLIDRTKIPAVAKRRSA